MKSRQKLFWSVALCLLLLCTLLELPAYGGVKRVLVLNSYNDGFHWTDRIMSGIKSVLDEQEGVELFINYMDTKRKSDENYFEQLRELYANKYRLFAFDVIVSSDDHALNFLLKYRDELFPGVPVVFCGINDYHPSRIAGHKLFTGVVETYDVLGTVELMLRLHPEAKSIATITDSSYSGNAFRGLVKRSEPLLSDKIQLQYLTNMEPDELYQTLREIPPETLVLWAIYLRMPQGSSISAEESVRLVTTSSDRPTYCLWDVVGLGVVGGKVTSPNYQGEAAASMAMKILHGERIEYMPVIGSPMVYKFDYQQLVRFNIDLEKLPANSIIINEPFSFYKTYRILVLGTLSFIFILTVLLLALLYNIKTKKIAMEALRKSRDDLHDSLEQTVTSLTSIAEKRDPYTAGHQQRVDYLACAIAKELGLPAQQIAGLHIAALLHDIGKIAVPAEYLAKPARLSTVEETVIEIHPEVGYEILKDIQFPWPVAEIVYQHHEHLDGSGYPRGLTDKDILLEAKILTVADVVEAMSSHRPYRPSLGITRALDEIRAGSGIIYHAPSVDACLHLILEKEIDFPNYH